MLSSLSPLPHSLLNHVLNRILIFEHYLKNNTQHQQQIIVPMVPYLPEGFTHFPFILHNQTSEEFLIVFFLLLSLTLIFSKPR